MYLVHKPDAFLRFLLNLENFVRLIVCDANVGVKRFTSTFACFRIRETFEHAVYVSILLLSSQYSGNWLIGKFY